MSTLHIVYCTVARGTSTVHIENGIRRSEPLARSMLLCPSGLCVHASLYVCIVLCLSVCPYMSVCARARAHWCMYACISSLPSHVEMAQIVCHQRIYPLFVRIERATTKLKCERSFLHARVFVCLYCSLMAYSGNDSTWAHTRFSTITYTHTHAYTNTCNQPTAWLCQHSCFNVCLSLRMCWMRCCVTFAQPPSVRTTFFNCLQYYHYYASIHPVGRIGIVCWKRVKSQWNGFSRCSCSSYMVDVRLYFPLAECAASFCWWPKHIKWECVYLCVCVCHTQARVRILLFDN